AEKAFARAAVLLEDEVTQTAGQKARAELALACNGRAMLLRTTSRRAEADPLNRRAIELLGDLVQEHPGRRDYRLGLAKMHSNRFSILRALDRADEANQAIGLAIAAFAKMAQEQPRQADYHSELGQALHLQATLLLEQGNLR